MRLHPSNTKPPYTVTGIIIHKLAASLFKPRGSKRGKKVAAYSPEITVDNLYSHTIFPEIPPSCFDIFYYSRPYELRWLPNHTHAELIGSQQAANRSHLHKVKECPTFSRQQRRFFSSTGSKSLPFYPNESSTITRAVDTHRKLPKLKHLL